MIDPICGMTVEPGNAAGKHVYNGQTYYFCSQHCLAKFKEDPEKFLKSPATNEQRMPRVHADSQHAHADLAPSRGKEKTRSGIKGLHVAREAQAVLRLSDGPRGSRVQARAMPQMRYGFGTRRAVCSFDQDRVRLSHASGDRASRSRVSGPICGMALEPRTVTLEEEANPELVDMTRRFWVGVVLSAPIALLAMSDMIPGQPAQRMVSPQLLNWLQLGLATPVVLWCGWPFFQRGWASIVNRSLNMFTLIAIGVGTAYVVQCGCDFLSKPLSAIFPRARW